jgi:hypothetical protein
VHHTRETEVANLHVAIPADEDIVRLEISVNLQRSTNHRDKKEGAKFLEAAA